jgi:hypothetical protein
MPSRLLLPIVVIAVAFYVFALVDLSLIDRNRVRGISKPAWIAVVILLPIIGAVLWFAVGRVRLRDVGGGSSFDRRGPVAPDDDPAFLNRLGREKELEDRLEQLERELRDLDDDPPKD